MNLVKNHYNQIGWSITWEATYHHLKKKETKEKREIVTIIYYTWTKQVPQIKSNFWIIIHKHSSAKWHFLLPRERHEWWVEGKKKKKVYVYFYSPTISMHSL